MRSAAHSRVRARVDDSGFTLVEAVVALFVLGIIFTALAAAAVGSLRASLHARTEQQAVDFATEQLERIRQGDYYSLGHVSADLAGDARLSACGTSTCVDPGTGTPEPLIVSSAGSVNPHITQVDTDLSNNVTVTLATYITQPDEDNADYKRVTVIASWRVGANARERVVSSFMTATTRGLPLPVFKITPLTGTATAVNPGASAPFALEVANQGAPDRWNLSFSGAAAADWQLYRDDGDGVWEASDIDIPLTNTNSSEDALIDTGRIDPTASVVIWAVRDVASGAVAGDYWSVLTARSAAQPTAATGTASVDLMVRVVESGTAVDDDPDGEPVQTAPGPPQNLQVTTGDGQLTLNWQVPLSAGSSAITDYVVYYKLPDTPSWTTFDDGLSTSTSATVTGLVNGTTYDIGVAAKNTAGVGAQATSEGTPVGGTAYVAPIRCAASSAAPPGNANNGYTLRKYALHNRSAANPLWPGTGTIAATSTIGQGLPLIAAVDGPQVPAQTNLPVYSADVLGGEPGRILLSDGSFSTSDTTRVVDWRSTAGSKAYKGTAVLGLWVAPVTGDDATLPLSLSAQLYIRKSNGTLQEEGSVKTVSYPANTFGAAGCLGWHEVWMTFPVNQSSALGATEYIGVRVWNSATTGDGRMQRVRVGYDVVDDFFSYLTVPEKP